MISIYFLEISGYLRNQFVPRREDDDSEYFGTITDGIYKLDVLVLFQLENQIDRGLKLEIIGDLQESGIHNEYHTILYYQQCNMK